MKIFIFSLDKKVLSIDIEPSDIIETVKQKIKDEWGYDLEEQILVFHGFCLDNNCTVADYNICKEDTINILIKKKEIFPININMLGIQNFTIDISTSETIKTLKNKISDKVGVPINKQNLIFSEMILEDINLIGDYFIRKNSTIDCIVTDYKINEIIIYVDINRKTLKIECNPLDTILSIKYKIQKRLGYPINIQNLIYHKDIILENTKNLEYYNLENNSIIFLELTQNQNLTQKKTIETENKSNISQNNTNVEKNDDCLKSVNLHLTGPPIKNTIKKDIIVKDDSKVIKKLLIETIIELEKSLVEKNNENEILKIKINELSDEMNKVKLELKNRDNLISVKFISGDQKINCILKCEKTDNFIQLENSLYELYPECKMTENDFLINGQMIDKNRSIEENKIKENDTIMVISKI